MYQRFGVMVDCSRNAVPNVKALKHLIDCLQKMGYNMLELYTEDTFEVEGEPYFGYLRGRYSGAELREIDAYAKARGIELVPCVQTLAHFTCPVRLPRFQEITDVNDILLIDSEKTYEFLDRIFASLAKNFTSRNVNIGMDEAHMVGLGKYLDEHGYCNRFEILNRHLSRVIEIAQRYGFRAHMWSDMFFRLAAKGEYYTEGVHVPPEVREKVPASVALAYWDYYHTEEGVYDYMIESHLEFDREVWFAGGAWVWNGFAPRTEFTYATMKPAMRSVRKHGIQNVLITLWGDNGGECPPFAVLQALYAIRRYADGEFDDKVIADGFAKLFGVPFSAFDLLELPNAIPVRKDALVPDNPCKSLFYADPLMGIFDKTLEKNVFIPYGEYAHKLAEVKTGMKEFGYLFESAERLCRFLEVKAYLGIRTRKAYRSGDKAELEKLTQSYAEAETRLQAYFEAFSVQWNTVNKPFGFEIQCARMGGLKQRLAYCRTRILAYLSGEIGKIEELEEEILCHGKDEQSLYMNCYGLNVTTGVI